MSTVTPAAVLAELEKILTEVIGDDLLLDGPLTMETSFDQDLQLESIEFVALAEQLLETYGEQVDFVAWMAEMELDEIIALTVVLRVIRSRRTSTTSWRSSITGRSPSRCTCSATASAAWCRWPWRTATLNGWPASS